MLKLGIVGLPNVGKSTLFNALTAVGAPAENYPFCTVEPNVGVVEVPDERLDVLEEKVKPQKKVPAVVQFVDIAGLVKGASNNEGLGNKFLGNIRETDAIVHVVRCFEDGNVVHVMNGVDPARDREVINLELALADLQSVEKQIERVSKIAKGGNKEAVFELGLLQRAQKALADGKPARFLDLDEEQQRVFRTFQLLTPKPVLYLANVAESDLPSGENALVAKLRESIAGEDAELVSICSKIEAELVELPKDERKSFLESLGLKEPGLNLLIRAAYRLLGLQSYFTAGEKEVRAWTIRQGARAPEAAGVIHSDFEKAFIRAETVSFGDFERLGSLKAAREQGLMRAEGKDYVVQDGDIMLFRTGA